ncbi:carboxypeptidase regulatory-like domain-containing protein [Acidobacteriota bacterium]
MSKPLFQVANFVRRVSWSFCYAVLCVFCTGFLQASETGEIKGKVLDEGKVPLPGVAITATSPSLQGIRTAVTDEDGDFKLPLLPVGEYSLTFELEGFRKTTQRGYRVRLGFTISINVVLTMATLAEEVTVTATQPLIDKTRVDTSYRVNVDELHFAPIQERTIEEIVAYTPGVTGIRASSLNGAGTGLPSFRGEGEEGNNWLIDGLSSRGVKYNDPGVVINYDAWKEVQIVSDGFSPDWGQAMGGTINIVTKSGGNEFHGEIGALIRNWNLRSDRESQLSLATEPSTNNNQFFGNLGGPIIKDKLWFFFSNNLFNTLDKTEEQSIGWLTYPAGNRTLNTNNFFGKLTYTPIERHTFSISGGWDTFVNQNGGIGLPETYTKQDYSNYSYRLNYQGILSSQTLVQVAYGGFVRDLAYGPLDEDFGPASYFWQDIGQVTNNAIWAESSLEERTDFAARLTHYLDFGSWGDHDIGAGFGYFRAYAETDARKTGLDMDLWKGNGFDNGADLTWIEPGLPTLLSESGDYSVNNATRGIFLYLMDRFTIGRFSIMLGLRTDTQKVYDDLGQEIWSWGIGDFLSPRFSIAMDILGDGKNILKFGYGKFRETVSTSMLVWYNSRGADAFRQYQWIGSQDPSDEQLKNPANWEFSFEQSSESTPETVDPQIKPNKMNKFLLEFGHRFGVNWAVKLRGVYSKTGDLIESIGIYDPTTLVSFLTTNFEHKKRDYRAIELELNGRIADRFTLFASYTWSQAKGATPGQLEWGTWQLMVGSGKNNGGFGLHPLLPDGHPDKEFIDELFFGHGGRGIGDAGWYGFLPYSVNHQVKALGIYRAPYNIMISVGIDYISGYHWEKKGLSNAYGFYLTFPERRGGRTTPAHWYLDLAVEKNVILPQGFALGFRLNFSNILNSQQPISYVKEDTSLFGEIWARQQPRWLQLQFIFRF